MSRYGRQTERFLACRTPEELQAVLDQDIRQCCCEVAKGRAILNALERACPAAKPKDDRAVDRLRAYGLDATWGWSSERGMALDLAELVEDLQALHLDQVDAQDARYYYRSMLLKLVVDKLDLDRGVAIRHALDIDDSDVRETVFAELQNATRRGWETGVEQVRRQAEILAGC